MLLRSSLVQFLLPLVVLPGALAATSRPNVLFVISDDLSSRISPAGYAGVQTPVLDRLASEATTFRRAYCQYPVCGPSRASFLSGLYPESTRVLDHVVNIAETRPGGARPRPRGSAAAAPAGAIIQAAGTPHQRCGYLAPAGHPPKKGWASDLPAPRIPGQTGEPASACPPVARRPRL